MVTMYVHNLHIRYKVYCEFFLRCPMISTADHILVWFLLLDLELQLMHLGDIINWLTKNIN